MNKISKNLKFEYNNTNGYLNSCITNNGEGLKISTGLDFSTLSKNGIFGGLLNGWDLKAKYWNKNKKNDEIFSKHKQNIPIYTFINSYIVKICSIINFEQKLKENSNYKFPTIKEANFSKKLKSIYNSYLTYLRYIITPNSKHFSNIFKIDKSSNRFNFNFQDKESYVIFKNIFVDYIAEKTNISSIKNKNKNNLEILNEKISEKNLSDFGNLLKKNNNENINKVFFIERRNLNKMNFIIHQENLEKFNSTLHKISKEIMEKVKGKIINKEFFNVLNNSNFTFILDEIKENENSKEKESFAYINNNDSILVLFNCNDHIQIIMNLQNYENLYEEYSDFEKILEILNPYSGFDDYFGYLTTNPLNSGTSFEIKVNMNNKNKIFYHEIKPLLREFSLNRSTIFINNFDIYNKIKFNYSRNEILNNFMNFIQKINNNNNINDDLNRKEEKKEDIVEQVDTNKP
jgi:protein-arginine kinase